MKTLLVLSALTSIALAAPALQGEGSAIPEAQEWHVETHSSLPHTSAKMSQPEPSSSTAFQAAPVIEVFGDATSGRSIALKKPIIVKKKDGYRLYRDSEEEKAHADSHESCGRQVRVKLCDENGQLRETLRNSETEISDIHSTEDDMKHSIKMAKEAVENLQKDLKKMEHKNAAMKMAHDSESDIDLHEDIEEARQVLEHIHENFGNLESMTVHATTAKDAETSHDVHLSVAKSTEERMNQWKEAMENIKKYVEVAKNIEDSFKEASHEDSLLHTDQFESDSTNNEHVLEEVTNAALNEKHHMRDAESVNIEEQAMGKENHETSLDNTRTEHLNEQHGREERQPEDDMAHSPSEAIEMKYVDISNHHSLKSENHKHEKSAETLPEDLHQDSHRLDIHSKHAESIETNKEEQLAKDSDPQLHIVPPNDATIEHHHTLFLKETEEPTGVNKNAEIDLAQTAPANTINLQLVDHERSTEIQELNDKAENSPNHEKNTALVHHQKSAELKETAEEHEHSLKNEHTLVVTENLAGSLEKSAEHIDNDHKSILEATLLDENIEKAAEMEPQLEKHHHHTDNFEVKAKLGHQTETEMEINQHSKTAAELHLQSLDNDAEQTEHHLKAADENIEDHHKIDYNESEHSAPQKMKSAEHHLHHPVTTLKAADTHLHHHLAAMKAAEEHSHYPVSAHWMHENKHLAAMQPTDDFKKDLHGMDHMRNSYVQEHHYIPNKMEGPHDFEMSEHGHHQFIHGPSRHHHHMMSHSMMHDPNGMSGNFHPNMRDAMEGLESEHMFRWQPTHESSRSAYGGGLSGPIGTSGAVGVFPNANSGGCGIPLLLSCSPSVVSGSLAKTHSAGYVAPAYRSEDDFGFHNKRDIKKKSELVNTNVLRSPSIVKQKLGTL